MYLFSFLFFFLVLTPSSDALLLPLPLLHEISCIWQHFYRKELSLIIKHMPRVKWMNKYKSLLSLKGTHLIKWHNSLCNSPHYNTDPETFTENRTVKILLLGKNNHNILQLHHCNIPTVLIVDTVDDTDYGSLQPWRQTGRETSQSSVFAPQCPT